MFAKWVNTECKNIHGYLCFMELRQLHEFTFQIFRCLLPFNLLCFFCFSSLKQVYLERSWTLSKAILYTSICASQPASLPASAIIIYTHFKTAENKKMTKKSCSGASEPTSPSSRHRSSWIPLYLHLQIISLQFFRRTNVEFVIICLSHCSKSQRINEFLTVDKKYNHALYHGMLYWYDMIRFFLILVSNIFHFLLQNNREAEKALIRERVAKKMAKSADEKRKIKQCKWKQSSAEQSQMQYHICVIVILPLCA